MKLTTKLNVLRLIDKIERIEKLRREIRQVKKHNSKIKYRLENCFKGVNNDNRGLHQL